jgi:hypothetical protein
MAKVEPSDDQREFMLVLRRSLLQIIRWIERKYGLDKDGA